MAKENLNICLVSREFPPDTAWGGIATFSTSLVKEYRELGHDVTVLSLSMDDHSVQDYDGVRVFRVKVTNPLLKRWHDHLSLFVLFYNFFTYRQILRLHRSKPFDVIDVPEHLAEGLFAAIHGKIPTVTRFYTPFSVFVDLGLNAYTKNADYYFTRLFEKWAIAKSTSLTAPSRDVVGKVQKHLDISRDVEIIPNPVDVEVFRPDVGRDPKSGVKVLFLGRLEERKGIHSVANAVPIVCRSDNAVQITILGRDTPSLKEHHSAKQYLISKWDAEGCIDRVAFVDPVPHAELAEYYQSHDIIWVPSLYDNSPYTCVEAMACGKAVIGSDAGGIPEYFGGEDCGIVIPAGDAEALANRTIDLIRDPERRVKIGQCARARVVENYASQVIAQKTIDLYCKTIEGSSGV